MCPLLGQEFIPIDQYIYYETDLISEIYFVQKGMVGFVLPLVTNIVYINIMRGDHFGEIDFVFPAAEAEIEIHDMITSAKEKQFNLVRYFTAQALQDTFLLKLDMPNLSRLHKQFNSQFSKLF